jgi:hypothetical protein
MKRIGNGEALAGLLACAAVAVTCGSPGRLDGTGGAGAGGNGGQGAGGLTVTLTDHGGAVGSGGTGGISGVGGTTAPAEGICGETTITPNKAPVDVLIVLDRSDSMGYSMSGDCYCALTPATAQLGSLCDPVPPNCGDRWTVVRAAIDLTVAANPQLSWGLNLFSAPDSAACSVALVPQVLISANSGPQIQLLLADMTLQLWTPTAAAVNTSRMYLETLHDGHDKAILLATDGEPNCKNGRAAVDDDMPDTVAAVQAAAAEGFPVYVVGIGPPAAVANLDQLAQVGGTGQYYPADSAQTLADSLATISRIVSTTCAFQTPELPPDDSKVYVYVDKKLIRQVASSGEDGWMFGNTSADIVLAGSYCEALLAGAPSTVQIIFGCPDYIPPPSIP